MIQSFPGLNMAMSEDMANICDEEVRSLFSKGAVKIPEEKKGFVSGIFVIPKNSGGFRPIINLKGLNKFVKHQHFKMEGINVLKDMVREGDCFTKIDIKERRRSFCIFVGKTPSTNSRVFALASLPPLGLLQNWLSRL